MTESLTTVQLREWLGDTEKIVSDVRESMRNLKRIGGVSDIKQRSSLESPDRTRGGFQEMRNTAPGDIFEKFISEKVRFSLVVQLCKLYVNKDTERRNFHKLFNRLKYDKYNNRLKQHLRENHGIGDRVTSKAELIGLVGDLQPELEARADLIFRLRTLRDRLYAHSDPGKVLPEVTLEELDDLVQLSVKIFNATGGAIFGHRFNSATEE